MKRLYTETEEIKITRKKSYIDVDDSYTQMYDSLADIIITCKSTHEINLMFYAAINSHNGCFVSNEDFFTKFNTRLINKSGVGITRKTFTTALLNLVSNKILVKGESRGQYYLNPLLIWRDDLAKRTEQITEIIKLPPVQKQKYLTENNTKN